MQQNLFNFDFTDIVFRNEVISPIQLESDIEQMSILIKNSTDNIDSPFIYLMSENTYKATVYYYAILKAGKIAVLVDPDTTDFELNDLTKTVPPCGIICPDNETIYPNFETDGFVYYNSNSNIIYEDLDDVCTIMFSNAEDGNMKAVQITYQNIASSMESCKYIDSFPDNCTLCSMLPYYHIFGLMTGPIYGTHSGGRLIIYELSKLLDVSSMIETFTEYGLTNLYSVPMVYYLLGKSPKAELLKKSLFSSVSGGYKLQESIAHNFREKTGIEIREGYGITEATGITYGHKHNDEIKYDSVGKSTPNTPTIIIDEYGVEVAPGLIGEVCLSGACIANGFYNNKVATAQYFSDGWFFTGDFGFVDEDGYLFLSGLKKRMLNIAGKNVYPAELERFIHTNDLVRNCNIYGEYSGIFGHKVIAEIELHVPTKENEIAIKAWCKNNISSYKQPKRWEFKTITIPNTTENTIKIRNQKSKVLSKF